MIAAGMPVARTGRRGRGGDALLDLMQIAEWRANGASPRDDLADRVPRILANPIEELIRRARTPNEKQFLVEAWYHCANAVRDALDAPELDTATPEMRKIIDGLTSL
jgi:hypothetical protein